MSYIYDLTDTWNAGGTTFTAIKMDVLDTASAAGSLLLDLQVGGASKFKVNKAGGATFTDNITGASGKSIDSFSFYTTNSGTANGFYARSDTGAFGLGVSDDVMLRRDAANTLAQRNSTNAQAFRVYNTYTDASNYERGFFAWGGGNTLFIGTEKAGTGSSRPVNLRAADYLVLGAGAGDKWSISTAGHFTAITDNTYDIGASGANRPRNVYAAGTITAGGDISKVSGSYTSSMLTGGFYAAAPSGAAPYLRLGQSGIVDFFLSNEATTGIISLTGATTYEFRNGTNAQAFRVYNTYTDASNYERLNIGWASNTLTIETANAGTGAQRTLALDGASLNFKTGGGSRWQVSSGHFIASADNTYDIGASGANRPRNVFVAGRANIGSLTIGLGGQTAVATNTALGFEALNSASLTGGNNVGVGYTAAKAITTGTGNVAIGQNALLLGTTSADAVAIGRDALGASTTGSQNTAVGRAALREMTTGTNATAVGAEALRRFVGGANTAIGNRALFGGDAVATNNTGTNNIGIGFQAGDAITTGSTNIVIGHDIDVDSATGSNQINIGDRYFHDRIRLLERSSDPTKPTEGNCIVWMSDGTGLGDDGDVIIASTAGGVTNYAILFDHSAGTLWS